jgi:hypothetical protein
MTWKKIDDYNSGDTGTPFQPYSAFVAQGLTQNARSYPSELTRGASIPFRRDKPVRWASYGEATGTIVWVNCGANATQIIFRLNYQTENNHVSTANRIGVWYIKNVASGAMTQVNAPANLSNDPFDIVFQTYNGALSGYQAFFIGFQSDPLDSLGLVNVIYISDNVMGLVGRGGGGAYTISTGEKFELIVMDSAYNVIQSGENNPPTQWQIGYLRRDPVENSGDAVIFPGGTTYPVVVSTSPQVDKTSRGEIFELGSPKLYSLSYVVTEANDYTPPDQFNHYHALALSSVNSAQSQAIPTFRPELANIQCDPYHFGRILTALPDALTSTFCVQSEVEGVVQIAFTTFPLTEPINDLTEIRTLHFDILDSAGVSIFGGFISENYQLDTYNTTTSFRSSAKQTRALLGVFTVANQWGMRDGLPLSDVQKGNQVFFEFPSAIFSPVEAGGVGVYTVRVETGDPMWIIAYNVRLV